jgi:hypothetical protein
LKVHDENSRIRIRIRIHTKMSWIRNTLLSYLADVLQVNAPDAAPPEPLPLLGFVELPLEDGEQAGDAVV